MKAVIFQPYNKKTEEEILAARFEAKELMEMLGYEIAENIHDLTSYGVSEMEMQGVKNVDLKHFAEDLELVSKCDAVYFCKDFLKSNYTHCMHSVLRNFGVKILYGEGEQKILDLPKRTY